MNNSKIRVLVPKSQLIDGKTYFYQAFARNETGESKGVLRKLIIDEKSEIPLWEDQEDSADGWIRDSWFGDFLPTKNGWLFHHQFGWIYAQKDSTDGLWLWIPEEGWIWTRSRVYPHIYSDDLGGWLYLMPSHSGIMFYDYTIEAIR